MTFPDISRRATIAPLGVTSLRSTFAWVLAGNIVYALSQWGMISVLARRGTTAAVGQFALALAITAPLFLLTNLFLRGIQATDASSDFAFGDYFTLRSVGTGTGLVIVALILLGSRHDPSSWGVVMFVAAAKAVESFTDVIAGFLQKHDRLDQVAISMMLKGGLSFLAFAAAYLYWHSVVAASAALCLTWAAVFVGYDVRVARTLLEKSARYLVWDRKVLLKLFKLAAPVGIVMALVSLNGNIPRYAIARCGGSRELGIFAALAYVVGVVSLMVNALGQSVIVRLSRSFAAGDTRHFTKLLCRMALLGIALCGVGVVLTLAFGRGALRLIYGTEYADHLGLMLILVAGSGIFAIASFLGYGMSAARRFREQLPVTLVTVATCAMAAFLLTPRWGLPGAGIAIVLSGFSQIVGSLVVLTKAVRSANDHVSSVEPITQANAMELMAALTSVTNE